MNELYESIQVLAFIDPVTAGFIISAGTKIGSALWGGPDEEDTLDALDAATQVSHAQKARVGQETDLAEEQSQQKTESLMKSATKTGRESLMGVYKASDAAISISDFAVSDEGAAAVDNTKTQTYQTHKDTVDQIVEEQRLTKKSIDLNTQKSIDNIEHELDTSVSSILSTPDTFLEKFTGTSDYRAG